MFQFNSELYELTQKYQALTKQKKMLITGNYSNRIWLSSWLAPQLSLLLALLSYAFTKLLLIKKLKELKNDKYYVEYLYKDEVNYYDHQKTWH